MRNRRQWLAFLVAFLSGAGPSLAASFGEELEQRWQGTWVVARTELFSDCLESYSPNFAADGEVTSDGARRFVAGELAKVRAFATGRSGIRLRLELAEPILVPTPKGPVVLYSERFCRVALDFKVSRKDIRKGDLEAVEGPMNQVLERFRGEREARASALWNGRERGPYPADYEATLVEYRAWLNVWIEENLPLARDLARRSLPRGNEEHYINDFAAGIREIRRADLGNCEDLAGTPMTPPRSPTSTVSTGRDHGRALAFALAMMTRLRECRDLPEGEVDES